MLKLQKFLSLLLLSATELIAAFSKDTKSLLPSRTLQMQNFLQAFDDQNLQNNFLIICRSETIQIFLSLFPSVCIINST